MTSNIEKLLSPTLIVILGATGDLAQRKLLPSLLDLHERNLLPPAFRIIGFAKSVHTNESYREFVNQAINKKGHTHSEESVKKFLECISYQAGDFNVPESYGLLSEELISAENSFGQCSNKLFYLAIPPTYYDTVFHNLANSGLTIPCSNETGWTRILVEKPFGKDVDTARKLDETLGLLFKEQQIFRIDHYLGKETLQNILMFRFSNLIFEPLWNNTYIEKVSIKLHETLGLEGRGAFYDGIGALRDVGQNHILQMLAAIAMENPETLSADSARTKRADVLKSLRPIAPENLSEQVVRGQYEGFLDEPNVNPSSTTETYFKLETFIDNDRWSGVPFILEGGKALSSKEASITIYFRETGKCLCSPESEQHHQNTLTFTMQPNEGISVKFWVKKAGFDTDLEKADLSFIYPEAHVLKIPDAYERILFDSIAGNQMLFTSTDEVAAAWNFITPILTSWDDTPMIKYKKGETPQ